MCVSDIECHPENISNFLLKYLDQKNEDEYLKAMSEYLKLIPDSFDEDLEVEHFVQILYPQSSPVEQQRMVNDLIALQDESCMVIEFFRAYVLSRLCSSIQAREVTDDLLS